LQFKPISTSKQRAEHDSHASVVGLWMIPWKSEKLNAQSVYPTS
jgi:hypothetical protein